MRKPFTLVMMLLTILALAKTPLKNYFELKSSAFTTIRTFGPNFETLIPTDSLFHPGIQSFWAIIGTKTVFKNAPDDISYDDSTAIVTLTDKYNHTAFSEDLASQVSDEIAEDITFESLKYDTVQHMMAKSFSLLKGGMYDFSFHLGILDIDTALTITFHDTPAIRLNANGDFTIGSNNQCDIYYNTGYPWNTSFYTGNNRTRISLMRADNTGAYTESVSNYDEPLTFDTSKPLLASIDTLTLHLDQLALGKYKLTIEADMDGAEGRIVYFPINDTLRATSQLEKTTYAIPSESKLKSHITMNYRFPYIAAVEPDKKPTIRVVTGLFKENSLVATDTTTLTNDSLATKELNYSGDVELTTSKVKKELLTDGTNNLEFRTTFIFNGMIQKTISQPVTVNFDLAAGITTPTQNIGTDKAFRIDGTPVPSGTKQKGIVIVGGKKVMLQ